MNNKNCFKNLHISGNVGIGVENPCLELEVNGDIRAYGNILIDGNLIHDGKSIENIDFLYSECISIGITKPSLEFEVNGSALIKKNLHLLGKLGIGTSNPKLELDVNGNAIISGDLTIGRNLNIEGKVATKFYSQHIKGELEVSGNTVVSGDLTIGGNLIFDGITIESVGFQDTLIKFGSDNKNDTLDAGFYNLYVDSGITKFGGLFRDCNDKKWKFFNGLESEPMTTVDVNAKGYQLATLVIKNLETDNIEATNFLNICDSRVNKDLDPISDEESLKKIINLIPCKWKHTSNFNKENTNYIYGLIAQDTEKIIPEAIHTSVKKFGNTIINDFKSINNNVLITYLIGSLKQQQKIINNILQKI